MDIQPPAGGRARLDDVLQVRLLLLPLLLLLLLLLVLLVQLLTAASAIHRSRS